MSSFRSEPFLWIHLAGLAVFPAMLELTWLGLAVGSPLSIAKIELLLVGLLGIIPILWMQLVKPFNIFGILFVALKPETLTVRQRQILARFKTAKHKWLSAIAAGLMMPLLWLLDRFAPLAIGVVSSLPQWRILGLAIAVIAFLLANLFLQVPLSVLNVLLSDRSIIDNIDPHAVESISQDFTSPGFKINRIPLVEIQN
ncbi:MAG: low-complexity tail membrane protein [Pleurocapsa sp.]